MVFSPSTYLVSAAVACVALQMQQVSAGSLYYGATTVTETQNEISEKSPLYGGEVDDQDCAVQVTIDPTLPNITTILPEPVEYPDLLANLTTAPADPVFTKVGEADLSEECPTKEADLDAYLDSKAPWTTTGTPTKTGIDTPRTAPLAGMIRQSRRRLRRNAVSRPTATPTSPSLRLSSAPRWR
ncbi:hypothetical protein AM588_10000121 [Phytophthora nicotianae]|uniref:Uncharacterized protein n=1 Tax=Phytophthora nicotianae TaxID=4792 RepID=A0A0W8C5H7_PHYNI|nr:hypothetical protein AM588_10000121 [Phytophthora nicotianae]